jgi:amino acid permease
MSDQFCEHESAVIRAARTGKWDKSLQSHAQTCPVCAEAMRVHAAMSSLIKHEQIPPIPDPKLIWLKAQFAERQRRSTIITRIAAVAYAALIGALGFGVYSLFGSRSNPMTAPQLTDSLTGGFAAPAVLVAVSIVLALLLSSPLAKRSN